VREESENHDGGKNRLDKMPEAAQKALVRRPFSILILAALVAVGWLAASGSPAAGASSSPVTEFQQRQQQSRQQQKIKELEREQELDSARQRRMLNKLKREAKELKDQDLDASRE
jgi:hypothetical protein